MAPLATSPSYHLDETADFVKHKMNGASETTSRDAFSDPFNNQPGLPFRGGRSIGRPLDNHASRAGEVLAQSQRLLPDIVDERARTRPYSAYARMPKDLRSWESGVRKITFRDLANAVNGMAGWILENVGPPARHCESVAYFGPYDMRYMIMTLAAPKAGYKSIFPNAIGGRENLMDILEKLECTNVLTGSRELPSVRELDDTNLRMLEAPSLDFLLDQQHAPVLYGKTYEEAAEDPILVVNTSGSTGSPKPIVYTNAWVASYITQIQSGPPPKFDSLEYLIQGSDLFSFMPPAHSGSFFSNVVGPIVTQMIVTFPPLGSGFTMSTLLDLVKAVPVDLLFTGPPLLDAVAAHPAALSLLKANCRMIGFAGGPLSRRTGDVLSEHFFLFPMYGSSENAPQQKLMLQERYEPARWNELVLNPSDGAEMRPLPDSGNKSGDEFELVIVRHADPALEQPVFRMFPDLAEWRTGDVFVGRALPRADDPAFTSYGYSHRLADSFTLLRRDEAVGVRHEVVNPTAFERALSGTPPIAAALAFGDRRPFPGLIVQLVPEPQQSGEGEGEGEGERDVTDAVWRLVAEANGKFGLSVERRHIIFTEPARPLPRAPKGTVQRAPANREYEREIVDLYRKAEEAAGR